MLQKFGLAFLLYYLTLGKLCLFRIDIQVIKSDWQDLKTLHSTTNCLNASCLSSPHEIENDKQCNCRRRVCQDSGKFLQHTVTQSECLPNQRGHSVLQGQHEGPALALPKSSLTRQKDFLLGCKGPGVLLLTRSEAYLQGLMELIVTSPCSASVSWKSLGQLSMFCYVCVFTNEDGN